MVTFLSKECQVCVKSLNLTLRAVYFFSSTQRQSAAIRVATQSSLFYANTTNCTKFTKCKNGAEKVPFSCTMCPILIASMYAIFRCWWGKHL